MANKPTNGSNGSETKKEDPIVCICLEQTESQLCKAIKGGAYDMESLMADTGSGTRCTACWIDMSDLLMENVPSQVTQETTPPSVYASRYPEYLRSGMQSAKTAIKTALKRPNVIYAAFGIERGDLHTRINVFNVDHPSSDYQTKTFWFRVICFSAQGKRLGHKDYELAQNGNLSIELAPLLKELNISEPYMGLLKFDTNISVVGSTRCYLHWYNKNCITSTHEKYSTSPIQWGYTTLTRVLERDSFETYIALTNLTEEIHQDTAHLRLANGRELGSKLFTLKPYSSTFFRVLDWFPGAHHELASHDASFYLEGTDPSLMTYYFTYNRKEDVWFAQHL